MEQYKYRPMLLQITVASERFTHWPVRGLHGPVWHADRWRVDRV